MKQESLSTENGTSKKAFVWYAVVFLVGFALAWFIFAKVVPARNASVGDASDSPLVLAGKNSIAIDDQLFGDSVMVKSVNLAQDSWIAIHEDQDGKPGNILGAAWFPAGTSSGAVELQRPTEDGKTYYAMLHEDKQPRGNDGHKVFDLKIDVPMTDSTGAPLMVKFMTTANPATQ